MVVEILTTRIYGSSNENGLDYVRRLNHSLFLQSVGTYLRELGSQRRFDGWLQDNWRHMRYAHGRRDRSLQMDYS